MPEQTSITELEEFDRGWLEGIQQTPWIAALYALIGLSRLGERPADLNRLAAIVDRPVEQTAALVRREFGARVEDGTIYWDDPFPGDQVRRIVHLGDHQVAMGSGCGPDVFGFAAVLDVPFWVEETCPVTKTPIRVDFVPDGYERVDPPEAVTMLLSPQAARSAIGASFEEINSSVCGHQPFFASAEAAAQWQATRPGSRIFTIAEMFERSWYQYFRDRLR